jgi:crotonobetainyl-CoA:carnitine CoA-transferase CaiB-like acyl-CoA transferase
MDLFRTLTVLSLEQATTLPFLTLRLAQDGMRVIRLEAPPRGDPNRWVGPELLPDPGSASGTAAGMNAYFLPNNLGKESITLNLAAPEGRELLHRLVRELPVDIFATNQRPGAYEKLGIDYPTLCRLKPDLIWLGITGFGPDSNEPAYDPILQARAGFMALTGEANGPPMVFGLPMVDLGAGEHAYGLIMRALYRHAVSGEGDRIDLSMFQSAVSWMISPVMLSHTFDIPATRQGNGHQFFAPVSVYPTADGYAYLAVGNDRQWQKLTSRPPFIALARAEYEQNAGRIGAHERLNAEMAAATRSLNTAELIDVCQESGVPVSAVNELADVYTDPLIAGRLVRACDPQSGVEVAISPPPVISDYLGQAGLKMTFPPRLGQHNEAVFGALGCDVADLARRGVL